VLKLLNKNKSAMIVLHEIYGINDFIKDRCDEYHAKGFDIYCPDMLSRNRFAYYETEKAYTFFNNEVGFDYWHRVEALLEALRSAYDKLYVVGFSVGATLAWRCCTSELCDGIICCYGSRIRDYVNLSPACPVLLLFASADSFDVNDVAAALREKTKTKLCVFPAKHGFLDPYSRHYNEKQARAAKEQIHDFLGL
jgi:dienelactone hydrolase